MGLFDRKPPSRERTRDDRERDRAERAARRAAREGGDAVPPPLEVPPPEPAQPASPRAQTAPPRDQPASPRAQPAPPRAQPASPRAQPAPPRARSALAPEKGARGVEAPSAVLDSEMAEDWSAVDAPPSRPPKPRGRGPGASERPRRRWPVVLAIGGAAAVLAATWFLLALLQPFHGDGDEAARVAVRVPKGASVNQAGDVLARNEVVASAFFFKVRARLEGVDDVKPGAYRLPRNMSYGAAFDALAKGPPKPRTTDITITEGRTIREADRLLRKTSLRGGYAAAVRRARALRPQQYGAPRRVRTLEGFLFPSTYEVRAGAPVSDLVTRQLQAFRRQVATVNLAYARSRELTPYDVLIIASMVEREAAVPRDRRLIASVIYNRLRQGIPLGIDATIRYRLDDWSRPLRLSELRADGPYNTRTRQGLPPTPIGNPGLASIRAAANPARTGYLYFVVKPCGRGEHAFLKTDAEFQRAAQRYERARRARGRSPVDC